MQTDTLTRRAMLGGTASACLVAAGAPLVTAPALAETTQGDPLLRMADILDNARARPKDAAPPVSDDHAIARDPYYDRFFRAWDRLSLQQQEEALRKLEAMFPVA